jgi:hypothetical protein
MRLPTLATDYWELRSGEASHAAHPEKFWIPTLEARTTVKRGQAVKLIFDLEAEDRETGRIEVGGERMWVIVAERVGEFYIGILDNAPAALEPADDVYLQPGAEIPFLPEHIVNIDTPPPEYAELRLSQPPSRRWPRS